MFGTFAPILTKGPNVNVLALDTSTPTAVIVLVGPLGPPRALLSDPNLRHGRRLVPDIRALLKEGGLLVSDLDALAVGLGPGSFTGLRIGVTAAKVLAYATGRPLFGLDSMELLARSADQRVERVAAVVDAQRGEVAVAEFQRDAPPGPLVRLGPTRVVPRSDFLLNLDPKTTVAGASAGWAGPIGPAVPSAEALADLALEAVRRGQAEDLWFLEPTYARPSVAEEKAAGALNRAGPSCVS